MQENSKFRKMINIILYTITALLPPHYIIAQIHQQIHDNQYSYIVHKSSPNFGV